MIKVILLIFLVTILTGCATGPFGTAASGGANYSYTKNADGCQVTINSARDVGGGSITIGDDCSVTVSAETAGGGAAMDVIKALLGKI